MAIRSRRGRRDEEDAAAYWDAHREVFALGVDGWWPDEGDPLDAASRLARIRMYWEGPQLDRPDRRPYALHRNGYAGMQRYGAFLWSGDVDSTWETLRDHVPVAINTSLTGIPYWGTDIGGFVPTKELTGELYVRWFQFGAFCPLFRSHGRTWKLRLPWGWNTGELGPNEIRGYGYAANPGPEELHNARSRADLPQVPGAALPAAAVPVQRRPRGLPDGPADHPRALAARPRRSRRPSPGATSSSGDPNILVGARDREGRRRPAGSICPAGAGMTSGPESPSKAAARSAAPWTWRPSPVRPRRDDPADGTGPAVHRRDRSDGPLTLRVYSGADGRFRLYEDDGVSFAYRRGDWMGIDLGWDDRGRRLTLRPRGRLADAAPARAPDRGRTRRREDARPR